jgi:multiple sugar transport system substrate-binding protein
MSRRALLAGIALTTLTVAACTAGGGSNSSSPAPTTTSHTPVKLTVWSFFTGRELKQFTHVMDGVTQAAPWITIHSVGGKQPTDILRAINSGTAPDVALEPAPDDSAKYCATGAWIPLNPFITRDKINLPSVSPASALRYTSYKGVQCSLPMLSDAYGLYYNTDMFKAAGIAAPPKTFSELVADAKRLTKKNPDGTFKVVGFDPLQNFYESYALDVGVYSGAQWYDSSGKSALASDPRWAQLLQWQKSFVDWYGYNNLTKWLQSIGGPDSEWTASNALESGKAAMTLDGEWRGAFIASDHAKIHYATAPFPVADSMAADYGAGQIGGTIIGIPKGNAHAADAWQVVKYLALGTQPLDRLANLLNNVPTTIAALKDPTLSGNPKFATFLRIFANKHSGYKQITPLGTADSDLFTAFVDKYLAGNVSNLQAGLQNVASQIDKQSQLG